jgi:hypothetical protein
VIRAAPFLAAVALLTGCGGSAPEVPQRRVIAIEALPAMKTFPPTKLQPPQRSNAAMARDILALEFQMESGREIPVLTRFEEPITIALTGKVPPTAPPDLARVIGRFRAEAGLDVTAVPHGPASITIEFVPRRKLQAIVPQAACFVVPRVGSWSEYRAARRTDKVDWITLEKREKVAIFVPSDTSPQEVRDCLHEELAQAMGPLNDLYELSDSVFNDDNFHTILTGFDMLTLRAHYAPELADGMTKAEVAEKLPALLARLNPEGEFPGGAVTAPSPREWIDAIETALGPGATPVDRRLAAQRALDIARAQGWRDSRLGFSWFALGRLAMADEMDLAASALDEAAQVYRRLPGTEIQLAHIDMQRAAFALSSGKPEAAIRLVDQAKPAVIRGENAALLASLLMIEAEARDILGDRVEARALMLDSLGWARYGFRTEAEVLARLAEISVLSPLQGG